MNKCDFCDELAGGQQNAYVQLYGKLRTRFIWESICFRVVPTLGQLVAGHILVIPTEHSCALADLPQKQIQELGNLSQNLRQVLCEVYGACIFFEHGIRKHGSGGCGIDHAHMHVVPTTADGILATLQKAFGGYRVERFVDINRAIPQDSSYLYFEDSREVRYVFPVQHIPSQYLRKLIAEQIGKTDWDWRRCGFEPGLVSTVNRLAPMFSGITDRG